LFVLERDVRRGKEEGGAEQGRRKEEGRTGV
jgi:hypothetical protein